MSRKSNVEASISKKFITYVNNHPREYLDADEFLNSLYEWPQKAARANRLVTDVESLCEKWQIEKDVVPWCNDATYFSYKDRVGNTTEHKEGLCYVGDPSAMLLVECIDIAKDGFVVDMCAAPGGKSIHLLNKLGPNATLIANDIGPRRARVLQENIDRMLLNVPVDVQPTVKVVSMPPAQLVDYVARRADVVIVDAPCSGEAMMRRSNIARRQWSEKLISKMSLIQKQLLFHAREMLNDDGLIGYSTCTFNVQENENIVNFGIETLDLKPVDLSARFTEDVPAISREFGLGLYPHLVRGDGQCAFVLSR